VNGVLTALLGIAATGACLDGMRVANAVRWMTQEADGCGHGRGRGSEDSGKNDETHPKVLRLFEQLWRAKSAPL